MTRRKAGVSAAILLVWGLGAAAWAQEGAPTTASVVRKNRAPVSDEVLEVTLPRAVEATLDNGVRVLILEDHRAPIVSVELSIAGAGGLYDPPDMPGLASMTASMLREGTETRTNRQINEEVARLGAQLSSGAGFGSTVTTLSASGLSRNLDEWFAILTDILLHPSFPETELERLKDQARASLQQQRTSPAFLASERFYEAVYRDHPAAVRIETEASIDAMSTEALARWRREQYAPQNAILAIAGDVDADRLIEQLNLWLVEWRPTDYTEQLPPDPERPAARAVHVVDRPGAAQTTLYLGTLSLDRRDPDFIALTVANEVLGGGSSARLFMNLREEKGYTYGAYSTFSALKHAGVWRAYADVRTEVTAGAMREFFNELERIREEPVPAAELEEVKRSIVAAFALSLEQPGSLLEYSTLREIYDLPADYWDAYPAQVMAVTPAEIQEMAERYFDLDAIQIVAVGDAAEIAPILEEYGAVTLWNAGGEQVEPGN